MTVRNFNYLLDIINKTSFDENETDNSNVEEKKDYIMKLNVKKKMKKLNKLSV